MSTGIKMHKALDGKTYFCAIYNFVNYRITNN